MSARSDWPDFGDENAMCRGVVDAGIHVATPQPIRGSEGGVDGRCGTRKSGEKGNGGAKRAKRKNPYLAALERSPEAAETLNAILALRRAGRRGAWSGLMFTPPGSVLDSIANVFRARTDIPLEIPFWSAMSLIAGTALARGVTIRFADSTEVTDLWTVVLAASGSSKTLATKKINKLARECGVELKELPEPSSAAAYVQEMADEEPPVIWLRDEFGKALKLWNQPGPMLEMQDYILRTYDHGVLERRTLKGCLKASNPALVIHATSVLETFKNDIPSGALVDGLAQRFGFVVAKSDPARPQRDYPDYSFTESELEEIRRKLGEVFDLIPDEAEMVVSQSGIDAYRAGFRQLCDGRIPASFFRRILWRSIKLAALFHFAAARPGLEIDEVDFGWALRATERGINDLVDILSDADMTELERMVRSAEAVKSKVEAADRHCTPRDIVQGVWGVKSTEGARALLAFIGGGAKK